MILYHLRRAVIHVLRLKNHTAFSMAGLVIGLSTVFLIAAWALQEFRYDRFHDHPDRIYMVTTDIRDENNNINRFPETPPPLAETLESEVPGIQKGFHFIYLYGGRTLTAGENIYIETGIAATPKFLEVLNFPLVAGTGTALNEPGSILLSESLSEKLFGTSDPIGMDLRYGHDLNLTVQGIFRDAPLNSSLRFNFLVPYGTEADHPDQWWQLSDATFIMLSSAVDLKELVPSIHAVWKERITDDQYGIGVIPLTGLRYDADFEFFDAEHGDSKKLYTFLGIALLILLLSCLNYLNLFSAFSIKREHETEVRKILGASSRNITGYLILESIVLSVIAWALAGLVSRLAIRGVELLLGAALIRSSLRTTFMAGLGAAILLVGFASGFYPALKTGRGYHRLSVQRNLHNAFILSQFTLTSILAVSCLLIIRQVQFMKNFETGFATKNIIEYKLKSDPDPGFAKARELMASDPDIESYTFAGASPVNLPPIFTTEKWSWKGKEESTHTSFYRLYVDDQYLRVFHISLREGRFFSSPADQNRVVINEKLAELLGDPHPVGHILRQGEKEYEIIGVVSDFNFQHLSSDIRPFLFMYSDMKNHLFVRYKQNPMKGLQHFLEAYSKPLNTTVDYQMVEEEFKELYSGENRITVSILFFTFLCIFLSVLGLVGMVTFHTEARTKEIAIRKASGASSGKILILLNMQIIRLFLPGFVVGSVIAAWMVNEWLREFANRRPMEWWVFFLGAALVLLFALMSVIARTIKAARKPPVIALKYQ